MQYRCEAADQLSSSRSCSAANVTRYDHAFMPWQHFSRYQFQHFVIFAFEPDHAGSPPITQLLVDALPRHPDHLADFLLGNGDGPASGRELVLVGQTNERAGEPPRQVLENDLLNLVTGPPQPRAKQLDELHRQRRLASHEGNKLATVDDEYFAIGVGGSVGSPRPPIEHRDFTENLAGADQIQNRTTALGGRDADLHRTAEHRKQAVAGISLGKNRGSPLQRGVLGITAELVERAGIKIAENRMVAQDR